MDTSPIKPKDIVVLVVVETILGEEWTFQDMADCLDVSTSQVQYSLERLDHARLFDKPARLVRRHALREFVSHGIRYAFATHPGELVRGIPTSVSAPVGQRLFSGNEQDVDFVWPHPEGPERGQRIEPLHEAVPELAREHDQFYRFMALLEMVRVGSARERSVASDEIDGMLME
ncbi:MAG: hypothetical protein ABEL76_02385 [Bradymonadaceae bacterium]